MAAPSFSDLIDAVARTERPSDLREALGLFCDKANRLLGAARSSVWLHDRRIRRIKLLASSDAAYASGALEVAADDRHAPAARALREDGLAISPAGRDGDATPPVLTAPLRGRRRALGTLVIEGPWTVRGTWSTESEMIEQIREAARRLSGAIEHAQLFDELLRSRQELENAFNSIADPVAVCDRALRIVHVNRAFANRAGRTVAALVDRPLAEFVGARLLDWLHRRGQAAALDETGHDTIELEDDRLNGIFSITASPRVGREGDVLGLVIVARDVSRDTALARERAILSERLTQSEKLAALGQFVAGIAHELNNPLQAVLGHLELIRATAPLSKPLARDLRLVYREAERAAKIVHNLLVFAGSRRLARRPVSLNAVLARALSLRGPAFRAGGIEIVRRIDDSLPRIHGNSLLLQQAILNILINAEQAVAAAPRRRIEILTSRGSSGDIVRAQVHDSGAGIPAVVLPRIFEPFFTTKPVGQGTGLGLAIAYGIIQEHGGVILAGNHADGGAVFTVQLPIYRKVVK